MAIIKGLWAPKLDHYTSMYRGVWCPTESITVQVPFIYNGKNYTSFSFQQTFFIGFIENQQIYTPVARLTYDNEVIWQVSGEQSFDVPEDPVVGVISTHYLVLDFGEEQEVGDAFDAFLRDQLGLSPVEGVDFLVPFEYLLRAGIASRLCGCGDIFMSSLNEKIQEIYEKGKSDAISAM